MQIPSQHPDDQTAHDAIMSCFQQSPDVYVQLNALRDWVNQHYSDFELYLEDVWNEHVEGETWFEYILRSRRTLNETRVLGYDVYKNHQDQKGVWHLDDYVSSVRLIEEPEELLTFIRENQG